MLGKEVDRNHIAIAMLDNIGQHKYYIRVLFYHVWYYVA